MITNATVNIRSCGSTDCGIIATANRGDELTVLDDSGDWYEIRLNDGSTAFVAHFLVGVNPPSPQPTVVPV